MVRYPQVQFCAAARVDAATPPIVVGQQVGITTVSRTGVGVYRIQTDTAYGIGECIPLLSIAENTGDSTVSSAIQVTVGSVTTFDVTIRLAGVPADIDFNFVLITLVG